jgi:hypothetical protein
MPWDGGRLARVAIGQDVATLIERRYNPGTPYPGLFG